MLRVGESDTAQRWARRPAVARSHKPTDHDSTARFEWIGGFGRRIDTADRARCVGGGARV